MSLHFICNWRENLPLASFFEQIKSMFVNQPNRIITSLNSHTVASGTVCDHTSVAIDFDGRASRAAGGAGLLAHADVPLPLNQPARAPRAPQAP